MRYLPKFVFFFLICGFSIGIANVYAGTTAIRTSSDEAYYRAPGVLAGTWLTNRSAPDSSRALLQADPILVTLVPPTTVPVCGSDNDEVVFPEQVGAVVQFDSKWVSGMRSITYASLPGYYIDGFNGLYTFSLTDSGPCLVTLVPPTTVPVCGSDNDEVVFPEQVGAVVQFDSKWVSGMRSITYASLPDYYIDGFNGLYTYGLIDTGTPCQLTAPLEPTQTAVCGPNNDSITIPAQPAGIVLTSDTMWVGNARTVTFSAAAGFAIEGQSIFEFADANVPCPPGPPTPSPTPAVAPTASDEPAKVTGLPNTGSGRDHSTGLLALAAIGAALMALPVVRRSRL